MITANFSFLSPVESLYLANIHVSMSSDFRLDKNDKVHAVTAWTFVRLICLVSVGAETECVTWCGNHQFFIDSQSNGKLKTLMGTERTNEKETSMT